MTNQERREIGNIIIRTIEAYTGPTGGWLESPAQVREEIIDALAGSFELAERPERGQGGES